MSTNTRRIDLTAPFLQDLFKKIFACPRQSKVVVVEFPVIYDQHGQGNFLFFRTVLPRHNGKLSVGFVQGVSRFVEGKHSRRAHGFDEVGEVEVIFFQLGNVYPVLVDDDRRLSSHDRLKWFEAEVNEQHQLVQQKNGDDGDDPVKQGDRAVCHRNARKFGNEQGNDEFKRLHFPDLSFSHQPHHDEQGDKDDRRA